MRGLFLGFIATTALAAAAMPASDPSISNIAPSRISPKGGTLVTITGENFVEPVRVIVHIEDFWEDEYDAQVVSVSGTEIQVLSPAINMRGEQAKDAGIFVRTGVGTDNPRGVNTYRDRLIMLDVLQPVIRTLFPNTGTILGGTHVGIFGDAFEPPVRVYFNNVEAEVVEAGWGLISVIAPASPAVRYAIIQVVNKTEMSAVKFGAFQYVTPMTMTRIVPNEGSSNGGTVVKIQGDSFPEHVQVIIGGFYASVLKSTPTEITALTGGVFNDESCSDHTGKLRLWNLENYDVVDDGPSFTYRATLPRFTSINLIAGERSVVNVADANAGTFTLDGKGVDLITAEGTKFVLDVPRDFAFPQTECSDGRLVPAPYPTTLTFRNQFTGCATSAPVVVRPPKDAPRCGPRGPRGKS